MKKTEMAKEEVSGKGEVPFKTGWLGIKTQT